MRRHLLLAVMSSGLWALSAQASLVQVEPDLFPSGTDIRTAFSGVSLSVFSQPGTAVMPALGTAAFFGGANISTTGDKVFARSPEGNCGLSGPAVVDTAKTWSEFTTCGILRADFTSLTDFVSIDVIFDDDDVGFLAAFNSSGTLLEQVFGSGDGRGVTPFVTLTLDRPTRDIAFVTAGGFGSEGIYLDNLQFMECSPFPGRGATGGCFPGPGPFPGRGHTTVTLLGASLAGDLGPFPAPEPTTVALLGASLAGLAFARRRKLTK